MVTINLAIRGARRSRTRTRRRYRPEHEARPSTISTRRMQRERARGDMDVDVDVDVDADGVGVGVGVGVGGGRRKRSNRSSELLRVLDNERPKFRSECRDTPRPCLYVSCRFHLYLDVNETTGSIKLNHPDREPWELEETCALDIAERGGLTHEEIGKLLNVTRERARQVEESGLAKLTRDL